MTGLLLVLMFVLTIFMVVQFVLRETITGQESELDALSAEVGALASALNLSRDTNADLRGQVGNLTQTVTDAQAEAQAQAQLIQRLTEQVTTGEQALSAANTQLADFEARVAALLLERDQARDRGASLQTQVSDLEAAQAQLVSQKEALELGLAQARREIDTQAEAARLAAAKREAMEALISDLTTQDQDNQTRLADLAAQLQTAQNRAQDLTQNLQTALDQAEADRLAELAAADALRKTLQNTQAELTDSEKARLAEVAAAEALRQRLGDSDAELTAMSLALEEQRKEAERVLTLLAAAETATDGLTSQLAAAVAAQQVARTKEVAQAQVLAELETRATTAEQRATAAEAALADLDLKAGDLDQALAAARADQAQVEQARGDLDRLQAARDQLARELATAQAALKAADGAAVDQKALQTQLAAALAAQLAAETAAQRALSDTEARDLLLGQAQSALAAEEAQSADSRRRIALLNEQVAALRGQLGELQNLLDDANARDGATRIELQNLGAKLNSALAQAATEERKRRKLEQAERERLEAEAARLAEETRNLSNYRSEFFGELRGILSGQKGVTIVGDRFVFSSEVLFAAGSADLSEAGKSQIDEVVQILNQVIDRIPQQIDWILRVDGHTDNIPLLGTGDFVDNWELSQARALSVVRYMIAGLGFPPERLAANGFGEFRPLRSGDTAEARAQNRRIELKLTER